MNKIKGRVLAILLALILCAVLLPSKVFSLEMQKGVPATTQKNVSVVGFLGDQWYVIGYNGDGVYSQPGTATLFLKGSGTSHFMPFRAGGDSPTETTWVQYNGGWYYEPVFNMPSDYSDSSLQKGMVSFTNWDIGKEGDLINSRTLTTPGDGINGDNVADQKMWPISYDEWDLINNNTVRKYFYNGYWLRTALGEESAWFSVSTGDSRDTDNVASESYGFRPAFNLNISSVLFASASSDTGGKSDATVGGGLIGATALTGVEPNEAMKFTAKHPFQTLTMAITEEQKNQTGATLTFSYTNATTGMNQYVSCVLLNDGNEVAYYGKLADSFSVGSGDLNLPLAGVADGTYTLQLFSEEANGTNFTDFCSETTDLKLIVLNGIGRLDFSSSMLYDESGVRTSASTADIRFSSTDAGTYFYQLDGTLPSSAEDVMLAGNSGLTLLEGVNTFGIGGLSDGEHIVYVVGVDGSGNFSNILTITIPAYVPTSSGDTRPVSQVPKTGDNGGLPGWLMLSLSLFGILLITALRKYRRFRSTR